MTEALTKIRTAIYQITRAVKISAVWVDPKAAMQRAKPQAPTKLVGQTGKNASHKTRNWQCIALLLNADVESLLC